MDSDEVIVDERERPTTRGAFLRSLSVVMLTTFFGGGIPLAITVNEFWSWDHRRRDPPDRRWAGNTPASKVRVGRFWGPFLVGAPIGALVGLVVVWRKYFFRGRRFKWDEDTQYATTD